jgi:UDP-glucose 4-epimerase
LTTSQPRVLVLGSAGFIGSSLCRYLAERDFTVHALGRSENQESHRNLVRIRGSIEDRALLRDALAACDSIVYAAAVTTPGNSSRDPALEVLGNLLPLAHLLECASDLPGRRVIYLSSGGAIYGDPARAAAETHLLRPRSYYGAGKVAAEALLHACAASSDWAAVALRPSNLYGPGQRATKGFAIVPTLFDRAIDGEPFRIWGDGSSVRDYCYIDDLLEAIALALGAPLQEDFSVYNVASGQVASVLQLVEACQLASGKPIRTEFLPPRGIDVACVSPDSGAISQALGWTPAFDLATGLERTWHWHRNSATP